MKKIFLTISVFLFTIVGFSQYGYRDSNRIGITVGVNQFSLLTDNFESKPLLGWNLGLSVRGNFRNSFDMVYAMQFSENNFTVSTTNSQSINEDVKYKLSSAQISLLLSYVIVENHISFEFGPMIQVNGKLTIDKENENNRISNSTLLAKDILDISKFNFYPTVGITTGLKHFRANFQYQYGVNNILGNLNNSSSEKKLKGNAGIISGNIIIYL